MTGVSYSHLRVLEMEGRHPEDAGVWVVTAERFQKGEGLAMIDGGLEVIVPHEVGEPYPPSPKLDDSVHRIQQFAYRRLRSAADCQRYLRGFPGIGIVMGLHIFPTWDNPLGWLVPMPSESERPLSLTHAVSIIGDEPGRGVFRLHNGWRNWGEGGRGFGYIPYEYVDQYTFEAWGSYPRTQTIREFSTKRDNDPELFRWSGRDEWYHRLYGFEVRSKHSGECRAWTFVTEIDNALEVEELYVRKEYRKRGYGRRLAERIKELARAKNLPIRLWVPFADCRQESAENYAALVAIARRLGVAFQSCPVRWAAYYATNEFPGEELPVEPSMIPNRPRTPRADFLAAVAVMGLTIGETEPATPHVNGVVVASNVSRPPKVTADSFPKPGTPEWGQMNDRRGDLIDKEIAGTLTAEEEVELEELQRLSLAALNEAFPYPPIDEERERRLDERLRQKEAHGG